MIVGRTIRNGAVRIGGRTYRPSEQYMPYDGRLDGLRYAFGLYPFEHEFVYLHSQAGHAEVLEGPHCVDGCFPWSWWHAAHGVGPAADAASEGGE